MFTTVIIVFLLLIALFTTSIFIEGSIKAFKKNFLIAILLVIFCLPVFLVWAAYEYFYG